MIKKLKKFINDNTFFWLNFILLVFISYFASYVGLVVMMTGIGFIKVLSIFFIISFIVYGIEFLFIFLFKYNLSKKYVIFFLSNIVSSYLLYVMFYDWLIVTFMNFAKINY